MDDGWRGREGWGKAVKEPAAAVAEALVEKPAPVVSDETLAARMRAGQVAAGEELVRRYYSPLIGYLRRMTDSVGMAEEVHQQTWLSVLEHVDKFDARGSSSGSFKAWLFRIATNKTADYWRGVGREKTAKAGLKLVSDEAMPAADHRLEETDEERRLHEAIGQLTENQRQVLLLRYYSKLKFVEIAAVVGCPLNTALGRMHKAMLKLKELMGS